MHVDNAQLISCLLRSWASPFFGILEVASVPSLAALVKQRSAFSLVQCRSESWTLRKHVTHVSRLVLLHLQLRFCSLACTSKPDSSSGPGSQAKKTTPKQTGQSQHLAEVTIANPPANGCCRLRNVGYHRWRHNSDGHFLAQCLSPNSHKHFLCGMLQKCPAETKCKANRFHEPMGSSGCFGFGFSLGFGLPTSQRSKSVSLSLQHTRLGINWNAFAFAAAFGFPPPLGKEMDGNGSL